MVHRFYTTPETARELTALKKKNGFYFRTLTRTDNIDRVYCEVTDPGYQFIKENGITIDELNYVIRDREAGNEIERFATREEAEQQLAKYEEQDRADGIFVEDFYEIKALPLTYDVVFNDDESTNAKGMKATKEDAIYYVQHYNGTNESYFADYKGGVVQVVCNETGDVVYEETVR